MTLLHVPGWQLSVYDGYMIASFVDAQLEEKPGSDHPCWVDNLGGRKRPAQKILYAHEERQLEILSTGEELSGQKPRHLDVRPEASAETRKGIGNANMVTISSMDAAHSMPRTSVDQ